MEKSSRHSLIPFESHEHTIRLSNLALAWPVEELLPTNEVKVPILKAGSFEELYAQRHAIQRYFVALAKSEEVEAKYKADLQARKKDPNYHPLLFVRDDIMQWEKIAFVMNEYPYDLPPDTTHFNL